MTRRPGITLLEVLVAIFVMGIGLLAILVLFPLGAITMARSLQDDRCAQCAQMAANLALSLQLRSDTNVTGPITTPVGTPPVPAWTPVYVDCFGLNYFSVASGTAITGGNGILRVAPSNTPPYLWWPPLTGLTQQYLDQDFALLDDITFTTDGVPSTVTQTGNTLIERGARYTWAYFIQSGGTSGTGGTQFYDLNVVVYVGRSAQSQEVALTPSAAAPVNSTSILVGYPAAGSTSPRRGSWILDAGPLASPTPTVPYTTATYGYFYRVVDVGDTGSGLQLDLERPLRKPITVTNAVLGTTQSQLLFLEDVAEVFERGNNQ
jgi:hypothetical protein